MTTFKTLLLALSITFALGACKKDGEEIADEMEKLKNEVCACKDEACAEKVNDKRRDLRKKARDKYKKKEDIDKEILQKLEKLDDEFRACRRKFDGGDAAE